MPDTKYDIDRLHEIQGRLLCIAEERAKITMVDKELFEKRPDLNLAKHYQIDVELGYLISVIGFMACVLEEVMRDMAHIKSRLEGTIIAKSETDN